MNERVQVSYYRSRSQIKRFWIQNRTAVKKPHQLHVLLNRWSSPKEKQKKQKSFPSTLGKKSFFWGWELIKLGFGLSLNWVEFSWVEPTHPPSPTFRSRLNSHAPAFLHDGASPCALWCYRAFLALNLLYLAFSGHSALSTHAWILCLLLCLRSLLLYCILFSDIRLLSCSICQRMPHLWLCALKWVRSLCYLILSSMLNTK